MKKLILFIFVFASFASNPLFAQIYMAKHTENNPTITFFSAAPMENITAVNHSAVTILKTTTNEIQISISIQNFKFKNALMEEHFNENYMESEKYPKCIFKGRITETVDWTKEGETPVTVVGKMELHGVTKEISVPGTITKKGNDFHLHTKFNLKVADYNIKVPSMYVKNIAEEVEITFDSILEPYKRN